MFLKPQLARECEDRSLLRDPAWIAEPKLDGVRAQIHVREHRTLACFSRVGRDVLGERAARWLREVDWPFAQGVLDGELYAGDGRNQAGATQREAQSRAGQELNLAVFDLLELDGVVLRAEPWWRRRKQLEALFEGVQLARVSLTPVSDDGERMWQSWVETLGGEGIMLKHRESKWVPGWRSFYWLKVKQQRTVDVVITGVTDKPSYQAEAFRTGEVALTYGYFDVKRRQLVTVGQGIKFGRREELEPLIGKVAELKCAGVMPSGALRHHVWLRWREDKRPEECVLQEAA